MAKAPTYRNRIVGHGEKTASEFQVNPLNWRKHPEPQQEAIRELLRSVGWVTGVIENVRTGNLIDGHLRIEEALASTPKSKIPYTQVDLSEEEERKILLLLDPVGSMATTDDEAIRSLMEMVGIEHESLLAALTGFNDSESLETDEEPNLNDPAFNYQSQFGVIVICESEPEQKRVYNELLEAGYEVKVVVV